MLIPFTINGAIASPPLARPTADASAGIVATAFAYNTRPTRDLWFNARFRSYDFDNNTPSFDVTNTVKYDTTLATINESSSPFQFSRRTLDLDSSWTPTTFAAFRAAYSLEKNDETFRTFDTTTRNTLRLSVDSPVVPGVTLRGVYEYSKRTGIGTRRTVARRPRRADVAAAVRHLGLHRESLLRHRDRAARLEPVAERHRIRGQRRPA